MNLSRDPNPSTRPRMDHALCAHPSCLPLRGLLPAGAPAWNTLGSPRPPTQNLQTQWARTTAAQGHGERDHCPICPHCCRNRGPVNLHPDPAPGDLGWVGGENSRQTHPARPGLLHGNRRGPARSHLDLLPAASTPGLARLWQGKQKPRVPSLGPGEPSSSPQLSHGDP